jgi:hypothetical protein
VTREEFLIRLNVEANLLGLSAITDGILADWLEAKIIDAPEKHGQIRDWSETELTRGRKILRLISLGRKNLGEIRFHLWIENCDIPFLGPRFDAPGILSREFLPLKNQLFGKIRSSYPANNNPAPDSYSAKSVLRNMGELDSCFEHWVKYEAAELLDAYTMLRFGDSNSHLDQAVSRLRLKISSHLVGVIGGNFPGIPHAIMASALAAIPDKAFIRIIRQFHFDALNDGIFEASKAEFLLARRALNAFVILFRWLGLQRVSDSLRHPTWQTAMFVLLLRVIQQTKGTTLEIEPQVFDFIEKIPA